MKTVHDYCINIAEIAKKIIKPIKRKLEGFSIVDDGLDDNVDDSLYNLDYIVNRDFIGGNYSAPIYFCLGILYQNAQKKEDVEKFIQKYGFYLEKNIYELFREKEIEGYKSGRDLLNQLINDFENLSN